MEIKTLVLERMPPGDRWKPVGYRSDLLSSLTDGLNFVFEETGCRQYFIDAAEGKVYGIKFEEDKPAPPKRYSLYED
jgi:hypothetical protein